MRRVKRACPDCHQQACISIAENHIRCNNDNCDFDVAYACPLCNASLDQADYIDDDKGGAYTCPSCQRTVPLWRIAYMIENGLIVDPDNVCQFCHGPTVHREDMNLNRRCFFYPTCSGQGDLFASQSPSYVFLDFETTGLQIGRDAIIEIGALKIDKEGFETTYQTFVKPPQELPENIVEITGITRDMVADAPDLQSTLKGLIDFIGDAIVVAHNADFDLPWLVTSSLRHNIPLSGNGVICTLKWAKKLGEPHASLGALTRKYKIGHENAHRALADAVATKELFFIFENKGNSAKTEASVSDYHALSEKIIKKYEGFVQP